MESSSIKLLKQSGLSNHPSEKVIPQSQRYPSQYDESSVRTDITEADIMNYVKRVANKAMERAETQCQTHLCDEDMTVEDCPQNECYKTYLDPNHMDRQKIDPSKKVFFDNFRDLISSQPAAYQEEPDSYVLAKNRIDELLQNVKPRCDTNLVETPSLDMIMNKGTCSNANPNGCDQVYPNVDCGNRECYKKYLSDEIGQNPKEDKNQKQTVRVMFNENEDTRMVHTSSVSLPLKDIVGPSATSNNIKRVTNEFHPNKISTQADHQKKYNTLVVNNDISVPEFIDVLIVVSEKPIKITLPQLSGPALASTVGNVVATSNLLIKNLSLCSHQIVTKGNNKIDTVRTSVAIEPAGKKVLGAVHDTWVLL
jgi:hypothetical protein